MTRVRYKLSATTVKKLNAGKYSDGAGLYLRKRNKDAGKWAYIFARNGQSREMGLGSFPTVSLSLARQERDKWAAMLQTGSDPVEVRKEQRKLERETRMRDDPTLTDAVAEFLKWYKSALKRNGEAGRWRSPLDKHVLPKIGNKRLSTLNDTDIIRVLKPLWTEHHPTAQKTYQRLRMVLTRCRKQKLPADPAIVDDAINELPIVKHKSKKIVATEWDRIPTVYEKLAKLNSSHLALRFLMLTAVRANSACGAQFGEIRGDVWTVPAARMKSTVDDAEDFRVPLSKECLDIVKICRSRTDGPFLFPGHRGKPIHGNALLKALNDLDEKGRVHGFRSGFKDWCRIHHPQLFEITEKSLSHEIGTKATKAYCRDDLLGPRRELMKQWSEHVTQLR